MTTAPVLEKKKFDLFGVNLSKREINKMVYEDFDRGYKKFIRPTTINGMLHGKATTLFCNTSLVVCVEDTPNDSIMNWVDDKIIPKWFVRICRDPDSMTRHLQKAYVYGPAYEIGRRGSSGPFYAVSTKIEQMSG